MGAYRSKLTPEEVEELASTTHFSSREIDVLYSRFKKLDRKRAGYITSQEFYLIPELSMNPLCDRIIALLDPDKSEQITFDRFVQTVNLFSQHATMHERTKAVFQLYDVDGDGVITSADLLVILHLLVGDNISESVLHAIVSQTLSEASGGQPISLERFSSILQSDISSSLTLHMTD